MPPILKLPNEVLLDIIDQLSHQSLENFTLACKEIFAAGHAPLTKHRKMKRKYSTILCGTFLQDGEKRYHHPALLLCDIIMDPSVAKYPTKLLACYCKDTEEAAIGRLDQEDRDVKGYVEIKEMMVEHQEGLGSKLDKCRYLGPRRRQKFKMQIMSAHPDFTVALLVTMLPNLRSMDLSNCSERCDELLVMIKMIGRKAKQGRRNVNAKSSEEKVGSSKCTDSMDDEAGFHSLSRLLHGSIHNDDPRIDHCENFHNFAPFVALPSLKSLYGRKIGDEDSIFSLHYFHAASSDITRIEFDNSAINTSDLKQLLSSIPNLQYFKYQFGGHELSAADWRPFKILQYLARHHSHSLRSLDLTERDDINEARADRSILFLSDLRVFKSLKFIRVDNAMFIGDEIASLSQTDWGKRNLYLTLLPQAVESLALAKAFGDGEAEKILEGLPERKDRESPKLREIIFDYDPSICAETKKRCEGAGIELKLGKELL